MKTKLLWSGGITVLAAIIIVTAISSFTKDIQPSIVEKENTSNEIKPNSEKIEPSSVLASGSKKIEENTIDWQKNGVNDKYITKVKEGNITASTKGVVETDTDCEADEEGISRCNNQIKLEKNQTIMVINIHNMNNYACFSPGDTVEVEPLDTGWVKTTKLQSASVH